MKHDFGLVFFVPLQPNLIQNEESIIPRNGIAAVDGSPRSEGSNGC